MKLWEPEEFKAREKTHWNETFNFIIVVKKFMSLLPKKKKRKERSIGSHNVREKRILPAVQHQSQSHRAKQQRE